MIPTAPPADHLVAIFGSAIDAIWYTDADDAVTFWNPAAERLLGYGAAEMIGRSAAILLPPDRIGERPVIACHADERPPATLFETVRLRKDGTAVEVEVALSPVMDSCGQIIGTSCIARDISVRRAAQREVRLLYTSLAHLNDIVLITEAEPVDAPGPKIVFVNEAFERHTGYSAAEALGRSPRILQGVETDRRELDRIRRALEAWQPVRAQLANYKKDGTRFWVEIDIAPVADEKGWFTHWISVQRDITERKTMERALSDSVQRDKLTGLANRTMFLEQLELAIERFRNDGEQRFAVFFLDFDRFKLVNDTLGHGAGDELLRQITQRLRTQLRASDVTDFSAGVLSRFGGDEFLLLINRIKAPTDAVQVAERLLNALVAPYEILGREVHSSASIGIVTSDDNTCGAEEVVRNADVAMYEAKRAGRACWVMFNESMHTRLTRHMTIESDLRHAIANDELYVAYQPIVDLATGRVVSAEALLRWQHPTLGAISPAEFIPIAEETGLIIPVGRWVQQQACRALAQWQALDPEHAPVSISVNVSRAELFLGDKLFAQLQETIEQSGLPPHCLTLEVTEREVMRDPEATIKLMHKIKAIGIKMSMDDFGTGTSSLGVLRSYPFDTIKIDRSFVSDLPGNKDVLAVIHATVNLIENLGMTSLAEGVETAAQAAVLHSLGCRLAQGYLFSRPILPEQMLATIAAGSAGLKVAGHALSEELCDT